MSCGILFACSRALNVDNSGHMKMECCAQSDMSSNLQFKYAEDADTLWKKKIVLYSIVLQFAQTCI